MSRTSRLWRGAGLLTWGGLLLLGASARADDASLARQLSAAGRASLAQGRTAEARQILLNALKLDPNDAEARAALAKLGEVRLVAFQDPAPRPDTPPQPTAVDPALPDSPATIADSQRLANVARQEFNYSVGQRLQEARGLTNAGRPGDALDVLRGALNSVRSADQVSEAERRRLENQVRVQIGSTESAQQRVELEQAELYRRQGADDARLRTLATYERNQERIGVLMTEFDNLMAQGIYLVFATGGLGDIDATTLPFAQARERAIAARAIDPNHPAPRAGIFMSQTVRFLAQSYAYEELKEYRFMLTMQDIDRSSVPFPDTRTIEYPKAVDFVALTEKRRPRYGDSEQLLDRDSRTKAITTQLNERLTMSFPNETPLEDVLKYIKDNTRSEELDLPSGIPIYVDPVGLQEADKTVTSPVTLDLEGIPLKTSLRLILKQLGLTYTVKDGLMTITTGTSEDVPTEIRVYQVADLAIIPISLISGGGGGGMGGGGMGGGGMGGGMGGGGMGGGGMGGGGMGGGMGGGGGGMGGFGSVPPQDPATLTDPAGAYAEKKSS